MSKGNLRLRLVNIDLDHAVLKASGFSEGMLPAHLISSVPKTIVAVAEDNHIQDWSVSKGNLRLRLVNIDLDYEVLKASGYDLVKSNVTTSLFGSASGMTFTH